MTVIDILSKLVAFPVLGGQSNEPIAKWIEQYLLDHNVDFTRVPNEDESKWSIHCRIGPAIDGGIVLSGHMDVVPVEGQSWDTDPFVLTDRGDGKLYARGSCDMKGFLACCLAVLPQLIQADLKIPIYFAFSYDEEIGCLAGTELAEHILLHYEERPKYAIIGEPTMMQPMTGQKGIVIYKTSLNGSAGHSSRIMQEVSAIHEASRLVLWLENKMKSLIDKHHIDDRFNPPHTTIHIGKFLQSGIAPNVISDFAEFYWDVRVIPQNRSQEILEDFNKYCIDLEEKNRDRFPGFKINTIEDHPDVVPLDTSDESEVVELIRAIAPVSKLGTVSYAAEAGQFSQAGFEAVICGPGDIAQAHRANEFIAKDQLALGVDMLKKLIAHCS